MDKYNILAVDEELQNLQLIKTALQKKYNVIVSDDISKALEILKQEVIHIVITDQIIKGDSGLEFLNKVNEINSEAIKIIISSHAETDLLINTINNRRIFRYILKPWEPAELKIVIKNAVEAYKLSEENKQTIERLKENYSKTLIMLANTLEARDNFVQGHSERVAYSATCIAKRMGISQIDIDLLYSACLLHDIGRIGIPERILRKTSDLDDEDLMYIKAHSSIGERILSPIPDFAKMLPLIRYHHERIDGKGYPDGISGDEIPILARIIAVVDTFDAITSDRPYRKGRSFETAIKILEESRGTQLDSNIVDMFINMLKEKKIISIWDLE